MGAGTWWANDATHHPFAGVALGKGRRRTLTFSTDAAMSLLAALAERLGVEPAMLALDGHPQLRATLARRARVTGTVKLGGAKPGTFRVKLAGRLVQ